MPRAVIIDDYFGERIIKDAESTPTIVRSHGLICAEIFQIFSPQSEVTLLPVATKFGEETSVELLANKVKEARLLRPDLIVMSMGTTNPLVIDSLVTQVHQAARDGIVLVCSCSNDEVATFPASLPEVIGVRNDKKDLLAEGEYCYLDHPYDGINIISAFPDPAKIKMGNTYIRRTSNSLATQHIGAVVSNLISELGTSEIHSIRTELRRRSAKNAISPCYYKTILNKGQPADGWAIQLCGTDEDTLKVAEGFKRLFAEDGYCAGIAGKKVETDLARMYFSLAECPLDGGISKENALPMLFRMAKIDLLFVLPDAAAYPTDINLAIGASRSGPGPVFQIDSAQSELRQTYPLLLSALK